MNRKPEIPIILLAAAACLACGVLAAIMRPLWLGLAFGLAALLALLGALLSLRALRRDVRTAMDDIFLENTSASAQIMNSIGIPALLFDSEALSLPVLKPAQINLFAAQSGTGLEDLLGAFGYTAYTDFYNEQDGTVRVFLDDTSTLRLNASGLVQYASTDGSATVSAYDESDITDAAALDAQLDCARLILDAAQRAGDTDTHASLYAVERSGEQTTLIFLQMYSGVPVLGDADFATFVFDGSALRTATIRLQKFQPTGGKRTGMPAKQAAAGASGAERGLMAAYRAQDGQYVPSRFYLKNAAE